MTNLENPKTKGSCYIHDRIEKAMPFTFAFRGTRAARLKNEDRRSRECPYIALVNDGRAVRFVDGFIDGVIELITVLDALSRELRTVD